jgi:hypothetical protein
LGRFLRVEVAAVELSAAEHGRTAATDEFRGRTCRHARHCEAGQSGKKPKTKQNDASLPHISTGSCTPAAHFVCGGLLIDCNFAILVIDCSEDKQPHN